MDFKDTFIIEHERLASEMEERGVDRARAYDLTADAAYDAARDRLADIADNLRQRAKDEG